jgi:hypothetical protein
MNERDRVRRRRRLVGAGGAVTLVALGLGLAFSAGGTDAAAADPITVLAPAGSPTGQPVDGISRSEEEQLAFHIHAHLQIYVDGQQRALPPGVGIVPPLQVQSTHDGPFVVGGTGIYWLHTHDSSGIIHIESPVQRDFTLGEVFDVWGQPLGPQQVGPAKGPVTALVKGVAVIGDPRQIVLNAHDVIQLDVGAVVPFQTYRFAPGL